MIRTQVVDRKSQSQKVKSLFCGSWKNDPDHDPLFILVFLEKIGSWLVIVLPKNSNEHLIVGSSRPLGLVFNFYPMPIYLPRGLKKSKKFKILCVDKIRFDKQVVFFSMQHSSVFLQRTTTCIKILFFVNIIRTL